MKESMIKQAAEFRHTLGEHITNIHELDEEQMLEYEHQLNNLKDLIDVLRGRCCFWAGIRHSKEERNV